MSIIHAHLNNGAEYRVRDKFGNSIVHLLAAKATAEAFQFITEDIAAREVARYQTNRDEASYSYFDGSMHRALLSLYILPGWGLLTPIHMAAESGNKSVLALMLSKLAEDSSPSSLGKGLLLVVDALGWSPLHWAALRNDVATCQLLREAGTDLHQRDYISRTPLDVAISFQRTDAARALMEENEELSLSESSSASISDSSTPQSGSIDTQGSISLQESLTHPTSLDSSRLGDDTPTRTHGNMMHFVLITTSLLVLVCSTAEVGFRNLSILTRQHSLESIKKLPLVELCLLTGPALLTALVLGCSDQLPTAHLHCLRTARNSKLWRWLADILLCLIALVPIKCGPLMLAHQLLLEERQLDLSRTEAPISEVSSRSHRESAAPPQTHPHRHAHSTVTRSKAQSLLKRTQELWLRPLKLFNYHPPPCDHITDTWMCPRRTSQVAVRTVLVRAEMRPDWVPILAPLLRLTGPEFDRLYEQFDGRCGGTPQIYHLIACLWFFQSVIIPRVHQERARNQPPTGTTLPTSSEMGPSSQEAVTTVNAPNPATKAIGSDSAQDGSNDIPTSERERSEEISDFDYFKQAETPLRPRSDEDSQAVAYASTDNRHWMEEMMPASSPPCMESSPEYQSDSVSSEESDEYEEEEEMEEADESELNSGSSQVYSNSESERASGEVSSESVEEGRSLEPESSSSSIADCERLGSDRNVVKLTPQFGLVAPSCALNMKSVFCQPVLAPYGLSGLTAEGVWVAFEKWYKEYLRVCDFLHEKVVMDSSVLRVDMDEYDDRVPGGLIDTFLERRLDAHLDIKEYKARLRTAFAGPEKKVSRDFYELDCVLKALR